MVARSVLAAVAFACSRQQPLMFCAASEARGPFSNCLAPRGDAALRPLVVSAALLLLPVAAGHAGRGGN